MPVYSNRVRRYFTARKGRDNFVLTTDGFRTCAVDNTCVLCEKCFNEGDHQEHEVTITVSSGSGGSCDCGDVEAWKPEAQYACRWHRKTEKAPNSDVHMSEGGLSEDDTQKLNAFFGDLLDYCADVILLMPREQKYLLHPDNPIPHDFMLDPSLYNTTDRSGDSAVEDVTWKTANCAYLWNDESHSFEDVISQSMQALGVTRNEGKKIALATDTVGRTLLKCSNNVPVEVAEIMGRIRLCVSLRKSHSFFQEEVSAVIINWLFDLLYVPCEQDGLLFRRLIARTLMNTYRCGIKHHHHRNEREVKKTYTGVEERERVSDDDDFDSWDEDEDDEILQQDTGAVLHDLDIEAAPINFADIFMAAEVQAAEDEELADQTSELSDVVIDDASDPPPVAVTAQVQDGLRVLANEDAEGDKRVSVGKRDVSPIRKTRSSGVRRLEIFLECDFGLWKAFRAKLWEFYTTLFLRDPILRNEFGKTTFDYVNLIERTSLCRKLSGSHKQLHFTRSRTRSCHC